MKRVVSQALSITALSLFLTTPAIWAQERGAQGSNPQGNGAQSGDQAKSQAASQVPPTPSPAIVSAEGTDQNPPQHEDSLAEAARRTREKKKQSAKSVKTFTNDDIAGAGAISTIPDKAAPENSANAPAGTAGSGSDRAAQEKEWRAKFASLRSKLDQDQQQLDVMQRELGVLDVQYYSDPVKGMQQGLTRSDINDQATKIDKKKQEVEADKQAIDTAEDDLRKAGGDPGWSR